MSRYAGYIEKQMELDNFILKEVDAYVSNPRGVVLTDKALINNMILAGLSECVEIRDEPYDHEEWIDLAHFVFSIMGKLDLDFDEDMIHATMIGTPSDMPKGTVADDVLTLMLDVSDYCATWKHWKRGAYVDGTKVIARCSQIFGLILWATADSEKTFSEIYMEKYKKNIERQKNLY